jgi:GT2 family glycosyltransferase
MITSSIVLYKTNRNELSRIIECTTASIIDVIYVIDNSPTNELESFIGGLSGKIVYIFNTKNIGYGGGHNIALKKAMATGADYHIVLNPDIYFKPEIIEILADYMNRNNEVGAVMPMIKYPDGETQYLCKLQPTPFDLFGRRFLPDFFTEKRNNHYELRHSSYDKLMNIPCLSGCFMFLRVGILKETGIFDDNFFMYCEDFDFYRRIHAKYKTMFYPDVTVVHAHQQGSYISKKLLLMHIKSAFRYFNKWGWFFDKGRRAANRKILAEIKNNY